MSLAIILLGLCALGAIIGSLLYTRHRVNGVYDDVQSTIDGFFGGGLDDPTSLCHKTVDSVGKVISDRIATTLEARLMATASHQARAENLLTEDVVTDLASQEHPLLGMALNALPSVRKRLAKNPTALNVLLPMIANLGKRGIPKDGPGEADSVAKRIRGGS